MTCSLSLQGSIAVNGNCGCSGESSSGTAIPLSLACGLAQYSAMLRTQCPTTIQTSGVLGANWVELPATESLGVIQFLFVKSTSLVMLRIGAEGATKAGSGGTFPTSFSGGEVFAATIDGVAVATTFTSGAQTAVQVASQINQAAIAAGFAYLPASVGTDGQLRLTGAKTGDHGSVVVTTANATIGFAAVSTTYGKGKDLAVRGLALVQFDPSDAPARVQISGSAQIEVLAAGEALAA